MNFLSRNIANSPDWPDEDYNSFGEVRKAKLSRIQRVVGKNLYRNWVAIPHVTHNENVNVDQFFALKAEGKLEGCSFLAVLVKEVANTLKEFPYINASLNDDWTEVTIKNYYHIGIAVDTDEGLLVPVVRDCDKKDATQITIEISELANLAKSKKLLFDNMQGGSFTISSIGQNGGTSFTPIINAPQVAILGATKMFESPVRQNDDSLRWSKFLPISLSYDHRVINGAYAARFCSRLAENFLNLRYK